MSTSNTPHRELSAAQAFGLYTAWREEFGSVVDGDASVECTRCGALVIGDGPPVPIECLSCYLEEGGADNDGRTDMASDDPLE